MALNQLLLSTKLKNLRARLKELRAAKAGFAERRTALKKREKDVAAAIKEAQDKRDALTDEEKDAVEKLEEEFTADVEALESETEQNADEIAEVQDQIEEIKEKLDQLQDEVEDDADEDIPAEDDSEERAKKKRSVKNQMVTNRTKFFGMTAQQRDAFMADKEVRSFLDGLRAMKGNTRAVSGGKLTVPQVVLSLVSQLVEENSKLIKYVNLEGVPGTARRNIAGTIPEAVWTEQGGKINELGISFNDVEIDGFKVAGFLPIENWLLEDSDNPTLAAHIVEKLAQAIGLALDKAIIYGTGVKMPMGIITRLAQTAKPSNYPETGRAWVDLHTSHLKAIATSVTGVKLFQELLKLSGNLSVEYSKTGMVWVMNHKTHVNLKSEALSVNAAGAIVTGMGNEMPVIGGHIEELEFMPDGVAVCGYGDMYMLGERAGMDISSSEHVLFIEDKTVFKATARYDGKPVIPEAFMAIMIGGTAAPTANAVTFAPDTANAPAS